jgi:hypothetical protein
MHVCIWEREREREKLRSVCFFPRKTFFEKSFSFFFFCCCVNYFSSLNFSFSTHSTWPPSCSHAVVRHCQSCRKRRHYCRYRHKLITVQAKCHRIFFLVEFFFKQIILNIKYFTSKQTSLNLMHNYWIRRDTQKKKKKKKRRIGKALLHAAGSLHERPLSS